MRFPSELECERLMGLPDGWTKYGAEGEAISSGQRYRALGNAIAPIFTPCGFGFWQAAVALLTGLIAKEMVVSSLSMFYGFSLTAASGEVAARYDRVLPPVRLLPAGVYPGSMSPAWPPSPPCLRK